MEDTRQTPQLLEDDTSRPRNESLLSKRRRRLRLWGLGVFVVGVLAVLVVPQFFENIRLAAIQSALLDRDYELAVKRVDQAIARSPKSAELHAMRAEILFDSQRDNPNQEKLELAIDAATQAIELADKFPRAYQLRGLLLQTLGRKFNDHSKVEEAVADYKRSTEQISERIVSENKKDVQRYAIALNARAYARALADIEIDEGLADIEKAFHLLGHTDNSAFIDTRGYLLFKAKRLEEAHQDMNRAIVLAEKELARVMEEVNALKEKTTDEDDLRSVARGVEEMEFSLGVLYDHRCSVRKSLKLDDAANQDAVKAKEYGFNPGDF